MVAQRRREERREERSHSSELRERTSKTRGVNGGQEYFDEKTGRFKRWPVDQKEPGEVVKRVKVKAARRRGRGGGSTRCSSAGRSTRSCQSGVRESKLL